MDVEIDDHVVPAAAAFASVALLLSLLLTFEHLRSYTKPDEQKWIVGVIFMVPVYAIESIISLWNPKLSIECGILRNCYEAFALYCFGSYLVACLGGDEKVRELLENESKKQLSEPLLQDEDAKDVKQKSSFTNFFYQPIVLGKGLYAIEKFGLVQYMILKTSCAFLALILELFGVYGDGKFQWYYGYPYITVVINFSQMWALYCLVQFYNVTHHQLRSIRPLEKFISFKAIVFATWWQEVGIAILCSLGILPKQEKFQRTLQDFLICVEMGFAAAAHVFVFSVDPYLVRSSVHNKMVTTKGSKRVPKPTAKDKQSAVLEDETCLPTPGTSVTESVQDIFLSGGEHVVKDVVLTINQAIEPVEKGVIKIQETIHHMSIGSSNEEEPKIEVEEVVEQKTEDGPEIVTSRTEVRGS